MQVYEVLKFQNNINIERFSTITISNGIYINFVTGAGAITQWLEFANTGWTSVLVLLSHMIP